MVSTARALSVLTFPCILALLSCTPVPGSKDAGNPGTATGEPCTRDSDCLSGHCPSLPGEARVCRDQCPAEGSCPEGQACSTVDNARLCLPLLDRKPAGSSCAGSRECASGMCGVWSGATDGICVEPCPENEQCSGNNVCAVINGVSTKPYCVPAEDNRANGADCQTGRQCAGGRCMYWGRRLQCASGCAGGCGDGGTCVYQEQAGHACLVPLPAGSVCGANSECKDGVCYAVPNSGLCVAACGPDRHCDPGLGCASMDTTPPSRACVPLTDDRAAGQECQSELQCLSGRCARFATATVDGGQLCADPCDGGECTANLVCWGRQPDAGARGLCGPRLQ